MVNTTHTQVTAADSAPDYARYDKIWQRVAPALDPYPQVRAVSQTVSGMPSDAAQSQSSAPGAAAAQMQTAPRAAQAANQNMTTQNTTQVPNTAQASGTAVPPQPQMQGAPQAMQNTAPNTAQGTMQTTAQTPSAETAAELLLPGAEANPCCMGSAAMDMLEVIDGFAREESADAVTYFQIARCAPTRAASMALRELGRDAQRRARELSAADYLITGERKALGSAGVAMPRVPYRDLLRERYHAAACNAFNYARAEEGTTDPCLQRIFAQFSEENYAASTRILHLLAQVQ